MNVTQRIITKIVNLRSVFAEETTFLYSDLKGSKSALTAAALVQLAGTCSVSKQCN